MDLEGKGRFARQHSWILLLCLISVPGFAQQTAEPTSNIEISKLHWEKQVTLPPNFDPSVIPTNGTFADPASRTSPPIRILRSGKSEKNPHPKLTERALVQCIQLADDTVWQNSFARPGVCELNSSKALTKRKAA